MRREINHVGTPFINKFSLMISVLLTGCMSIHEAARMGNTTEVKKQLAWGVNPNSKTFRYKTAPLHEAAAYGHIKIVELLLENGADVNIGNEGSETPLHYAAKHGHTNVMKVLLENGADVSQRGTGCGTPLQWAAKTGQIKAAELLLAYGADVNHKGTDGWTALGTAVSHRHLEMVKLLLSKGADVNSRAAYGCTPLHVTHDIETGRILLQHGADPMLECNGRPVSDEFLKSLQEHD